LKGRNLAEVLAGLAVIAVTALFLGYALTTSGRVGGAATSGLTLSAKFDRIDGLGQGADVRIAGVRVGSVTAQRIDPVTFLAVLTLSVDGGLRLPEDTSAEITSESLLGGKYVALVPGGADRLLRDGGELTITQSAVSLESLLGRFIFSVTELAANRNGDESGAAAPGTPATPASPAPAPRPPGR